MIKKYKNLLLIFGVIFGLTCLGTGIYINNVNSPEHLEAINIQSLGFWENERDDGGYFTIVDEKNNILDKMARVVYIGDELIADNNNHYKIEKIVGSTAYAKVIDKNVLVEYEDFARAVLYEEQNVTSVATKKKNLIAIYHTHSAESYVPTDGTESIPGKGGVYKVGDIMTNQFEKKGVEVKHSRNAHEPRDSQAYLRSRRTATKLLKSNPAALIDIHRDGIPDPDFYNAKIDGNDVTKIRLVVGRQNQNMRANLDFAKKVKAGINKIYPGLIKSIFMAKGNYNQDLTPRSLLLEVGTYTNTRNRAEAGAKLFADALPKVLGVVSSATNVTNPRSTTSTKGDYSSLFIILGIVIVGIAGFLLISTGSISASMDKLKKITSEEFTNYLGELDNEDDDKSKKDK